MINEMIAPSVVLVFAMAPGAMAVIGLWQLRDRIGTGSDST